MSNEQHPGRLEPTRAHLSELPGADDNLTSTAALTQPSDAQPSNQDPHEDRWATRIGQCLDLREFAPPDTSPGAFALLPPVVVDQLASVSRVQRVRYVPLFDEHICVFEPMNEQANEDETGNRTSPFERACRRAIAWAYYLGWSEPNLRALAERMLDHRRPGQGEAGEVAELLAIGRWLVDGGPAPWKSSRPVPVREPSRPTLTTTDTVEYLDLLQRTVLDLPWRGRTGQTDRKVFLGLLRIARRLVKPSIELYAGVRDISDAAGVNKETVTKAIKRLEAAGFVAVLEVGGGMLAGTYRLRVPGAPTNPYTEVYTSRYVYGFKDGLSAHPAFRADCLGQPAQRLLDVLRTAAAGLTSIEWRKLARVERRPFEETYLPRLLGRGISSGVPLIEQTSDGWVLLDDIVERLDLIAQRSGAADAVRRRSEGHRRQKQNYVDRFARQKRIDLERYEMWNWRRAVDRTTGEIVSTLDVYGTAQISQPELTLSDPAMDTDDLLRRPLEDFPHGASGPALNLEPAGDRAAWHISVSEAVGAPTAWCAVGPEEPTAAPHTGYCRCCGRLTADVHPELGLPWHNGERMPPWVARIERRNGVEIPDELIAPPSPATDLCESDRSAPANVVPIRRSQPALEVAA